ncbi:pyroglutamyl-peptidase 1 isoform X1 [Bos mutus]|uniref:pyroglutamyl-peptidase 1 isoform X1 n=1 Tax=Bos mutus TaxID=72004 RepID=UPI0038B48FB8
MQSTWHLLRIRPFWGTHCECQLDCGPGLSSIPLRRRQWHPTPVLLPGKSHGRRSLELEKLGLGDSVDLHVYEIPVEYQTVQRLIPALWEKHSPQLVVHVGVSGMATAVTLEKCGHNKGYKGLDNCRFCPGSQCCVEDGPESIDSIIDMDAVCKRVTTLGLDVSVTISQDAGRYLCDFTYYTSLYQSHGRSAFVHVPPLGKPYNADQLGRALRAIIEEMLDLLEQSEGKINCCHEH